MASPQKENGHLDIANEIVERLAHLKITPSEWQILWVVWRKTWAWNKKVDWISLSQFEKYTGLTRAIICRAKAKLVYKRILEKSGKRLMFNKNYEKWAVYSRIPPPKVVYKQTMGSIQTDNKLVYNRIHTKETTNETNTKGLKLLKEKMQQLRKCK